MGHIIVKTRTASGIEAEFNTPLADEIEREVGILANAGISAVMTKLGLIIARGVAENDFSKILEDGENLVKRISD
jgi:hypothetical protein